MIRDNGTSYVRRMVQQIRLISLAMMLASTSMQVFFWLGSPLEQEGLTARTE
jgi:hypothetical protein